MVLDCDCHLIATIYRQKSRIQKENWHQNNNAKKLFMDQNLEVDQQPSQWRESQVIK